MSCPGWDHFLDNLNTVRECLSSTLKAQRIDKAVRAVLTPPAPMRVLGSGKGSKLVTESLRRPSTPTTVLFLYQNINTQIVWLLREFTSGLLISIR
jgi:hypothetical protein